MNSKVYITEKNGVIDEYLLTGENVKIDNLINKVKQMHLEAYHVLDENNYDDYIPSTIINSTNDLVDYLNSIKNNNTLDLSELNKLFKEYNNLMYSPQTMIIFKSLFEIVNITHLSTISINEKTSAYIRAIINQYSIDENLSLKIYLAEQNKMAFERLGINIKKRSNKQKIYQKTI